MATKAANRKWAVEVTANPDFCGVDAGGVQFAHGKATIESERLAKWFGKHAGYEVAEVKGAAAKAAEPEADAEK